MSNKQVSANSWNCHVSFKDEWKDLSDVADFMRGKFSMFDISYCCYSEEFGKQGVTPHLQGYTIFKKRRASQSPRRARPLWRGRPLEGATAERSGPMCGN